MTALIRTIAALREALDAQRRERKSIGLVPTMGALHAGHRRLLDVARDENDVAVATIFVNPTQFDRKDDLEKYPRTLDRDLSVCREAGVDLVFAPAESEMYPQAQWTWVQVPALEEHLCGAGRPGHFRGVATVVTKLFNIVQADRAYFGEKDAQQLAIIRRMVADLNVPITIVGVPTVREPDGLALSSRNQRLSADERSKATILSRALFRARDLAAERERSTARILEATKPLFLQYPEIRVEYFSVVDAETLQPVDNIEAPVLIAGAIWIGATRLIDNVTFAP